MNNPLVKIRFFGKLAEDLGRSDWALSVKSPSEALQAIEANTGKMIKALYSNWAADYFVVVNGKPVKNIEEMTVMQHANLASIDFMPVFKGAGSKDMSIGMIIAGVLLIALAIIFAPSAPATVPLYISLMAGLGVSLVFSGIAGLLAPTPKKDTTEKPANVPSYIFNGALNTYRQGNPVSIGFGRMIVGSQVISAGVRAVDVDVRQ